MKKTNTQMSQNQQSAGVMMASSLRAGTALVDISPKPGIHLAGYPHFARANTGIHDPVYASCLVLDDGTTRLALACMDLLMVSRRTLLAIRQKAEARTGIPAAQIVFSCSHTHSGPVTSSWVDLDAPGYMTHPDAAYMALLENKLVALIEAAAGKMFEARIGIEKGICGRECGIGGNRRDPKGPADPEVWTMGVQDGQGHWRACLVKYALHPTVIHEDSSLVTADYPAYVRQSLARVHPGMVLLFAQGTSGNQSTRYFRQGQSFEEAERIGSTIARAAGEVLARMPLSSSVRLGAWSAQADLQLKPLPSRSEIEARVARARAKYLALKDAGAPYLDVQNANLTVLGEEDTLAFVLMKESGGLSRFLEDGLPAKVTVLGIGDARVVCLPGELFVEFGKQIQAASSFPKTFVVTLANGALPGYVCTADAYAAGGYETGASLLTAQAGNALVETAVRLIQQSAC